MMFSSSLIYLVTHAISLPAFHMVKYSASIVGASTECGLLLAQTYGPLPSKIVTIDKLSITHVIALCSVCKADGIAHAVMVVYKGEVSSSFEVFQDLV